MAQDNVSGWSRVIEPKIPLLGALAIVAAAVGVYNKVQALTEAVVNLQIEVKAGNQSYGVLASEQALQKFRQANTEDDVKGLKAAVFALQQGRR